MIINLTLFDKYFNRQVSLNDGFSQYLSLNSNLIPFKTINNYLIAFRNGNLQLSDFLYNIFGNIFAFAPMALFIPRIIKSTNNMMKYFLFTSVIIIMVEITQMILRCGSCDIDDYILNIIGSCLFYIIFNNHLWRNNINKFLFLKENE